MDDEKIFKCSQCTYQTDQEIYFKMHMKKGNHDHFYTNDNGTFSCLKCSLKTTSMGNIRRHYQQIHLVEKPDIFQCNDCPFQTNAERYLSRHIRAGVHEKFYTYNEETKMFKCAECPQENKTKEDVKRHHTYSHKSIDEIRTFDCPLCDFKTKYRSSLKHHLLSHKKPEEIQMYSCSQCKFKTRDQYNYRRHTDRAHDMDKVFRCANCNYTTERKTVLRKHVRVHFSIDKVETFKCTRKDCSYITRYKTSLKAHMKYHERKEKNVYSCRGCKLIFYDRSKFFKHQTLCRNIKKSEVYCTYIIDRDIFQCTNCSFENKNKRSVKLHFDGQHKNPDEVKWYFCSKCDYKALLPCIIKIHENNVHNTEEECYLCAHCNFKTKYKKSLEIHLTTHMDPKNIKYHYCDQCDYKSVQTSNLKTHQLAHKDITEVRSFQCKICPFKTKYMNHMKNHLELHEDKETQLKFKCEIPDCQFQTRNEKYLRSHIKTHTKEKTFKCEYCLYTAKRADSVENHIKSIHRELRTCECYHCGYKAKGKQVLLNHIIRVHQDLSKLPTLRCEKCDYTTKHKADLFKHKKYNHKVWSAEEYFRCTECLFKTKNKSTLQKHLSRLHSTNMDYHKCPTCKFKTNIPEYLENHFKYNKHGPLAIKREIADKNENDINVINNVLKHNLNIKQTDVLNENDVDIINYKLKMEENLSVEPTEIVDDCSIACKTECEMTFKGDGKQHELY